MFTEDEKANLLEFEVTAQAAVLDPYLLQNLAMTGRKRFHEQGFKGKGTRLCVIDTGVVPHVEFGSRLRMDLSKNFCTSDTAGPNDLTDESRTGHGTHCASSAAGATVGVAPEAEIISYKVIGGDGGASLKDIVAALEYIYSTSYKDIDVISMSLGGAGSMLSPTMIRYADLIHKIVNERGIPIFAAAGNTGTESTVYPGAFTDVTCVGAIDLNRMTASFSTRSPEVDLAQVGVGVWGANYTGGYVQMQGTSMACPTVAGIALLVAGKCKQVLGKKMDEQSLYDFLKMSCIDINSIGLDNLSGAGFCTLGRGMTEKFMTGSLTATYNGVAKQLAIAPVNVGGRNLLPARDIVEAAGGEVFWTSAKSTEFVLIL